MPTSTRLSPSAPTSWPHGRWRIDPPGGPITPGTARLGDRRDALLAPAASSRKSAPPPNAAAVSPTVGGSPSGTWRDQRDRRPRDSLARCGRVDATLRRCVASRDDVATAAAGGAVREESWTPVTRFDPALASRIAGNAGRTYRCWGPEPARRRSADSGGDSGRDALHPQPDQGPAFARRITRMRADRLSASTLWSASSAN